MEVLTHQATDGLSQLFELCAPDGIGGVFHHRVHIWVQISKEDAKLYLGFIKKNLRGITAAGFRRIDHTYYCYLPFNFLLGLWTEQVHFSHYIYLRNL